MLAGTIGSRPAGSEANDRAREYLVEQLRALGFNVRVQVADARRPEVGLAARVHNIVATRPGSERPAIALVSHYDSAASSPGGADDGLGVAVSLEAARVLAGQPLRHTLAVIVTDAEELGLMGAAAFSTDPLAEQLGAYINIEAVGNGGPSLLFETGPGNGWIVDAWAEAAPRPRGGSFALEVYRRIPNDTDFSILKRLDVPGLNFAAVADGYAYHTARDTAERLASGTIEQTGHNVVRTAEALDRMGFERRSRDRAVYSDVLGRTAFTLGAPAAAALSVMALLFGVLAWARTVRASVAAVGTGRLILTALWSVVGTAIAFGAMVAAAWLLRESRESFHPWYARPDRFFAFSVLMGVLGAWSVARVGAILPHRARGTRHPVLAWAIALPAWLLLAGIVSYSAPAAAYLFNIPLLLAAVLLLMTPLSGTRAVRLTSLAIFAIVASLWGWLLLHLLRFAVGHFGRMPIITPPWIYATLLFFGGVMLAPPAIAVITGRALRRPGVATAVLLLAVVASGAYAYAAPAYTYEQPLRRSVMFVQDASTGKAYWQVGSTEPGLDLGVNPGTWQPLEEPLPGSVPIGRLRHPFVFSSPVPAVQDLPGRVTMRTSRVGDSVQFTVSVTPAVRGLAASFVMPAQLVPIRPTLPGTARSGRWVSAFGAVPPEGVAFQALVHASDEPRLEDLRVMLHTSRLPGGSGWQGLLPWLPQDRVVWSSEARYIVQPLPEVAPPQ
jgi:hypothetical protein